MGGCGSPRLSAGWGLELAQLLGPGCSGLQPIHSLVEVEGEFGEGPLGTGAGLRWQGHDPVFPEGPGAVPSALQSTPGFLGLGFLIFQIDTELSRR